MIRFEKTCDACPEQYDAFFGERQVGYLRLRWSHFSVTCPDVCGETVYEADVDGSGWTGIFEDENQRQAYLNAAKLAIETWIEENPYA